MEGPVSALSSITLLQRGSWYEALPMPDRIDYLGSSLQHLDSLKGDVISREADPQLQAIAAEVGKILGTPIALLTIMMKRTQLFRASVGLPKELAAARSTDRALAWCQLVVKDRSPLTVTHASSDARIPQDLVKRFGLEAYLGVPVHFGDAVVGSLCGIDVVKRTFSDGDIAALTKLAKLASKRLSELASEVRPSFELIGRAAGPAFSDMRNALVVLTTTQSQIMQSTTELAAIVEVCDAGLSDEERLRALTGLKDATLALDDLRELATYAGEAAGRVYKGVMGLEALVTARQETALANCLTSAGQLAAHHTNLVGGVEWPTVSPTIKVQVAASVLVATLTSLLSELSLTAKDGAGPIRVSSVDEPAGLCIRLALIGGHEEMAANAVAKMALLVQDEVGLSVTATDAGIEVHLALLPTADS